MIVLLEKKIRVEFSEVKLVDHNDSFVGEENKG